nr:four helix bundle protein [Avrilella dinanensis]
MKSLKVWGWKSFEELKSWQLSRNFASKIYMITSQNIFKDIDLQRQLRRATVSISSNIAEGFERNTDKEFIHFLFIAKGSAGEVRSQLYIALDLKFISEVQFNEMNESVTEISKLISGLIKYLQKSNLSDTL